MEKHNFVNIQGLDREQLLYLIEMAQEFEKHPNRELLKGKVIATLFYEPSTRTRLSFETAANRLGARVIGFTDAKVSSVSKGETLKDTILMVSNYADAIVMRHYIEGAAQYASEVAPVPIINAGDGAHQHPSQCLLDLYTINQTQGTLENLNIYLVGDLKYGRTVHSLLMAMRHFNPTFHFIAPKELAMPEEYKVYCREHNIHFEEHEDFTPEVIANADIIYMTRVQKERFSDLMEYERVKNVYILRRDMLSLARPNMKILHPLPRVNEIAYDVDDSPHAYYIDFQLPFMRRELVEALDERDSLAQFILKLYDENAYEIMKHMRYEEKTVFPYVEQLLKGVVMSNYDINTFSQHHRQVEQRLQELKSIIIKYLPSDTLHNNLLTATLYDIYNSESWLNQHSMVEDQIFIPAIKRLEKSLSQQGVTLNISKMINPSTTGDDQLSEREKDIIIGVVQGMSNKKMKCLLK